MKNPRKSLFYIFLAYNVIIFLSSIYIDTKQDDLGFLLNVKSLIPWMKYFTLFGLVLFFVYYVIYSRDLRIASKELLKSKEEHTILKAKLFDLQEQTGAAVAEVVVEKKAEIEAPDDSEEQKDPA